MPRSKSKAREGITTDWARIERWLDDRAPKIRASLRDGATKERIRDAGKAMRIALPVEVREAYAIHDGQHGGPPLFGEWALLSLDDMVTEWQSLKDLLDDGTLVGEDGMPSDPIRDNWWHPKWIPFASDSSGDFYCFDLAPLPGGDKGQVISYWHTDARREVLAPGFAAWLHQFADDLEQGRYRVADGWLERVE